MLLLICLYHCIFLCEMLSNAIRAHFYTHFIKKDVLSLQKMYSKRKNIHITLRNLYISDVTCRAGTMQKRKKEKKKG